MKNNNQKNILLLVIVLLLVVVYVLYKKGENSDRRVVNDYFEENTEKEIISPKSETKKENTSTPPTIIKIFSEKRKVYVDGHPPYTKEIQAYVRISECPTNGVMYYTADTGMSDYPTVIFDSNGSQVGSFGGLHPHLGGFADIDWNNCTEVYQTNPPINKYNLQ